MREQSPVVLICDGLGLRQRSKSDERPKALHPLPVEEEKLRLDGSKAYDALEWRRHFGVEEVAASIVSWHHDSFSGKAPEQAASPQGKGFLAQGTIGARP